MTVEELITELRKWPANEEVHVQFDVSDHDTLWRVSRVKGVGDMRTETPNLRERRLLVVIEAA